MSIVMMMMIKCEVLMYVDQISNRSCLNVSLSQNCYFPPSWAPQIFTPLCLAYVCKYYHITVEIFVDPFLQILLHIVKKYFFQVFSKSCHNFGRNHIQCQLWHEKGRDFPSAHHACKCGRWGPSSCSSGQGDRSKLHPQALGSHSPGQPAPPRKAQESSTRCQSFFPDPHVRAKIHLRQDCPPQKKTRL